MFKAHKIWSRQVSRRNLIMMFLTIVMGFGSVITFAELTIQSDISNARQTIARLTITESWTDTQSLIDISSEGIYIDTGILKEKIGFQWKILGIDESGHVIYVNNNALTDGLRTETGQDIYRYNGNIGIGTTNPKGKVHIVNAGSTDLIIQETVPGNAANIHLKNTIRTRAIWWGGVDPDIFYIGEAGKQILLMITPEGEVGIWTTNPVYMLDVNWDINTTGTIRIKGEDMGGYFIDSEGKEGQVRKSDGNGRGYRWWIWTGDVHHRDDFHEDTR